MEQQTMTVLTISPKGWVVIPAELRKKYGLKPGTRVRFVDYGGRLTLVPLFEDPIHQAEGMLAGPTSLTQALLRERAQDRERER
jgi:AbrB family looped-hinge helix DNA binding protein